MPITLRSDYDAARVRSTCSTQGGTYYIYNKESGKSSRAVASVNDYYYYGRGIALQDVLRFCLVEGFRKESQLMCICLWERKLSIILRITLISV